MQEQNKNSNKVVIITGASSGIGQAAAYEFAKVKYNLILTYNKNKQGIEATKNKCIKFGAGNIFLINLNLNNRESIKNCIQKVIQKYSKIDILINNAGYTSQGNLKDINFDDIEKQIKNNLINLIEFTKECLPYIKESIINIGSNLGLYGIKGMSTYSASKFGVRGFTKSLAKEITELKIYTVNPGLTAIKRTDYKGLAVKTVAQIIFNTATNKYKAKSGSDINVIDYKYGEKYKNLVIFLRFFKKII